MKVKALNWDVKSDWHRVAETPFGNYEIFFEDEDNNFHLYLTVFSFDRDVDLLHEVFEHAQQAYHFAQNDFRARVNACIDGPII